jgi:hypothetical protein
MVSSQHKLIAHAKKKAQSQAAGAKSAAFDKKQSAYARKAEEERVGAEAETNAFSSASARKNVQVHSALGRGPGKRTAKFNLNDDMMPEQTEVERELGALLGTQQAAPASNDNAGAEQDLKRGRKEKFEGIIGDTRRSRVELQKERDERNKAADDLDAEFDEVAHLVAKRNKRQEEVDAFATLGVPEVRQMLQEHAEQRTATAGRKFVLGASGKLEKSGAEEAPAPVPAQPVVKLPPGAVAPEAPTSRIAATNVPSSGADDFDAMMGCFKLEVKRAHAVDRTLLPEEEAARDVAQQLLQMDREARPYDERDIDRTAGERLALGGDLAFGMDEEDATAGQSAPLGALGNRQEHAVDVVLADVEEFCKNLPESAEERSAKLSKLASALWHASLKAKKHAEESFKLILIDCQRFIYKRKPLTLFHRISLYLATKTFPTTDFRHAVATPLLLLLSSMCLQSRLNSVADCREGLWHGALLLNTLSQSQRFAGEPIVLALNVISLQLPKAKIIPVNHGTARGAFPVLERPDAPVLSLEGAPADMKAQTLSLFMDSKQAKKARAAAADDMQERLDVLTAAYNLILNAANTYSDSPSFACIFETSFVQSFHRILRSTTVHPAIAALHKKTVETVAMLAAETSMTRTPLAMRMFRPRPLRMYDPILGDDTPSEKKEMQLLKKEHAADHKRVMRTLTAEARVEQRGRESEKSAIEARKQAKLNSIMAELQQQQHVMKTADNLKLKATSKKRASTNVVPKGGAGKKRGSD